MTKPRAASTTAYVCECGRKLTFQKLAVAKLRGLLTHCTCGLSVMAHDGLLYARGREVGDSEDRGA